MKTGAKSNNDTKVIRDPGKDIHTTIAAEIFGVPLNDVTGLQRRVAKRINYLRLEGSTQNTTVTISIGVVETLLIVLENQDCVNKETDAETIIAPNTVCNLIDLLELKLGILPSSGWNSRMNERRFPPPHDRG